MAEHEKEYRDRRFAPDLARNILAHAGTMIGVCATLIGLVKINEASRGPSQVDEYGGLIALVFLVSAVAAYIALRQAQPTRLVRTCERIADATLMLGFIGLTVLTVLFAYDLL